MTQKAMRDELNRVLTRILMRTLALRLASGLLSFLAVSAWLFVMVSIWTAATAAPPLWLARTVSIGALALCGLGFAWFVVRPIARMPGLKRLASEVEHREDFKDIVVAAFEFSRDPEAARKYNPALVKEVIRRAVASIMPLKVRFLFLNRRQLAWVPFGYGGLAILLLFLAINPGAVFDAAYRIADPGAAAAMKHKANIFATPGNITVLAGTDVEVAGIDFGETEDPVSIHFSRSNGFWKSEPTHAEDISFNNTPMKKYTYAFTDLRSSITYYFQGGEKQSARYRLNVVHKPIVTDLEIVRTPPGYTGETPDTLIDSGGNIQALEGTKVAVKGRCNNLLAHAAVSFDESHGNPIEFEGRAFHFGFDALEDGKYRILLEDTLGYKNDDPLVYSIDVFKDAPPTIDVLEPAGDSSLPRNNLIGVAFIAGDDYGIAEASIFFRKGGSGDYQEQPLPLDEQAGRREIAQRFMWDLSAVMLFPGNAVEYYLEVRDNNVVTGPGIARSRVYQIIVPTMAELYERIEDEDVRRSDLLEEAIRQGEEFKERIEKISREYLKTEDLDWSQKKEVDRATEVQQQMKEKLEEVQRSLDETLESLSDNRMTSQEIGEKMEEISRLLEEINSDALDDYIEKLRKAAMDLSPEQVKQALEELNVSAEDMLKRLERTAELLKAIRQEQRMEELVRKSREVMEKQKDLLDETSGTEAEDSEKMESLAEDQGELAEDAERIKKDAEDFAGDLDDSMKEIADQLREAAKRFSEQQAGKKMKSASKNLQRGKKSEAMEDQQSALDDLVSLFSKMSACQGGMSNMSLGRLAAQLQKIAAKSLSVSFEQEELVERLYDTSLSRGIPSDVNELVEKQLSQYKAAEKIADEVYKIAGQTLVISPRLLQALGEVLMGMQDALYHLERKKVPLSIQSAKRAHTSLNMATIEMLRSSKSCSEGSCGGMGMQDMLQQLLAGEQQMIKQSKELLAMHLLKEQLRQQRQAEMERLAAAQRSLKDIGKEMQDQLNEEENVLGRMEKILEEMDEVIRDLESGTLDEQTIEREERIMSRLLDAQRSIHERDYEKKRESVTAKDLYSSDGRIRLEKDGTVDLREAIREALKLKAPGEFEDLIRLYFRALADEHSGGAAGGNR